MKFGAARDIRFPDGAKLKPAHVAKYLDCHLNDKADATRELSKRMPECLLVRKIRHMLVAYGCMAIVPSGTNCWCSNQADVWAGDGARAALRPAEVGHVSAEGWSKSGEYPNHVWTNGIGSTEDEQE